MARILVIDDEPANGVLMTQILKPLGHQVIATVDARDGLAKIRRRHFDLILLDITMPGMDGYEFLEHLRTMPGREGTPVVVVTGRHLPEGVLTEARLGAVGHVAKPFLIHEIEQEVARVLGQREAPPRRDVVLEAETYRLVSDLMREAREANIPKN